MSEATHRLVQGMVDASFRGRTRHQGQVGTAKSLSARRHSPWGDAVRSGGEPGPQRLRRARTRIGGAGARTRTRRARNSVSSTSWPSRAWASRAFSTSSANASARSAPLSYREAARPTASRRRSSLSSKWCAGSFRVSAGEAEKDVAQKLEMGLTALGLHSTAQPRPVASSARPQSPGRRVDRTRRRADRPAHARAFAATAGGALPALAGGHGDRGFALDRQRVGGSAGQDRRQRSQAAASAPHHAPAGIRAALARPRGGHQITIWSRSRRATSAAWYRRGSGSRLCPRRWRGR